MSEQKPKDSEPPKEIKKADTAKASTFGASHSSSVSPPLVPMPEEEDPQDAEGMKRSLRKMGIRPPRPFDPKKDRNFESWLNRIEFHFEVTKCPVEDKTGSVLLLLDVECFEVAKHLGLKSTKFGYYKTSW